jgi:hypothetical protein
MNLDVEFLTVLLKERYGILSALINNAQNIKNDSGVSVSALAGSLRFIGIIEYLVYNDINSFRTNLTESVNNYIKLFVRFNSGESISKSYVSMIRYKNLFDALAVGDLKLAKEFAALMGGRDDLEKEHDHPFDYAFGYVLKAFVLNVRPDMERYCQEFSNVCNKGGNTDFAGYAQMFKAILNNDRAEANKAVASIVKGHIKQSKGRGIFKGTGDEMPCMWGIGIVNLARYYALEVNALPPLIPADLLTPLGKNP